MSRDDAPKGAIEIAAAWARRSLLPKRDFERAVTGVATESVQLARASFRGRTRRIILRTAPTISRSRTLESPLVPSYFDPWSEESHGLAARTRQIAVCRACAGAKTVTCPECGGSAELLCRDCGGIGRTYSARTGRNVQCRGCKGAGSRRCPCRDGLVKCAGCEGKGRAEEWLEVEESSLTKAARTAGDARADALDHSARAGALEPAVRWRGTSSSQAPEDVGPLLIKLERSLAFDPKTDRVEAIDFELYQSAMTTLTYELCRSIGTVQVQEWDGQIFETPASLAPLACWRRRVSAAVLAMSFAGLLLAAWYSFRHPYFRSTVNSGLLWALVPLLGLSIFRPVSLLALPKEVRHRGELSRWNVPSMALLVLAILLSASGNPSVVHAAQLAEAGNLTDALTEASACIAVGRDPERAASLHDTIRLRLAREATEAEAAWKEANEKYFSPEAHQAAEQHALTLTAREVAGDLRSESFEAAETRLALVPDHLKNHQQIRTFRFELAARPAKVCIEELASHCAGRILESLAQAGFTEKDIRPLRERADELGLPVLRSTWRTIASSRAPLDERLEACQAIDDPLRFVETAGTGAAIPVARSRVDEVCADLKERQQLLEERRREREERTRQARQRAWAYAPLRCNDGTLSPSCVCGQSSRRGCCSWHGGVDGCSAPYP